MPPDPISILNPDDFAGLIAGFNAQDEELYIQAVPNVLSWAYLRANIPFFECPDEDIQRTYYFRWWTYRKHIKLTPDGCVVSEFLPDVPWAGKHNTINLSSSMHIYEGRWLRDGGFLDDYSRFWFFRGGSLRSYTTWLADAILARAKVTGDYSLGLGLLEEMDSNFQAWQRGWLAYYEGGSYPIGQHPNGLFFQLDDREGTEMSIGGHGFRSFTNSAMFGDARAIAAFADLAGITALSARFHRQADRIRQAVLDRLWSDEMGFFLTLREDMTLVQVRELNGYTPWYFGLASEGQEQAWAQLMDPQGFWAPYGPTFAEQRHPDFRLSYEGHECQWNGPGWPMSTSLTLTAMANLLNDYCQATVTKADYLRTLQVYARSHQRLREDGVLVPWIDENLNPYTGDWISRTRLKTWENGTWSVEKGGYERGKDYNHSTFCDLVISGLVGLRPRGDDLLEVNPLAPADWPYFALDRVLYHGKEIAIVWDKTGERYQVGKGLSILVDGERRANGPQLERLTISLAA